MVPLIYKGEKIMIEKILLQLRRVVEYLIYIMIASMSIIIGAQVFFRFFLNHTPPWIQPLSLLLMVWIGFIGIAIGIQDKGHIKLNLFVSLMPVKLQKILEKIQRIFALAFGIFMLVEGFIFAKSMDNSQISGLGGVSSSVLYASVPVAGFLVVVYLLFEFLGKWRNKEDEEVK